MVLVRHAYLITSSAGAETEDAVRDLQFGLFMIAINPDFVCFVLELS